MAENCAKIGPQDCEPSGLANPGGSSCCLETFDEAGTSACEAAGGQCLGVDYACDGIVGPQQCQGQPGLCCLPSESDAGDAGEDASSTLCAAAGGRCQGAGSACTTLVGPAQACNSDKLGGSFCCALAGSCTPIASSYDQSCKVDSDCVSVHAGDSCDLCALNCPNTAISVSAQAQFMADLVNTPAAISAQRMACAGDCTFQFGPCCIGGMCQMGDRCPGAESLTGN